jgi:hypothetical protein
MKTIDAIVKAAQKLSADQFLQLRKKLERLEKKLWETELERTTAQMKRRKITDESIDRFVTRRRRESRPKLRAILDAADRRIDEGAGISHDGFWHEVESSTRSRERKGNEQCRRDKR